MTDLASYRWQLDINLRWVAISGGGGLRGEYPVIVLLAIGLSYSTG